MGKGRGEVSGKLLALKSCSLSPETGMPASKGRKIKKRKKKKGRGRGMERGSSSARALVPLQLGALLALALSVIFWGKKGTKLKKQQQKKNPKQLESPTLLPAAIRPVCVTLNPPDKNSPDSAVIATHFLFAQKKK